MAATQIGTDLALGATVAGMTVPNASNYIVESATEGDKELVTEDVEDANGALSTRIIYRSHAKIDLTLICLANASPTTDFVPGTNITNTNLYVNSATVTKTKSPHRVTVSITDIGIA